MWRSLAVLFILGWTLHTADIFFSGNVQTDANLMCYSHESSLLYFNHTSSSSYRCCIFNISIITAIRCDTSVYLLNTVREQSRLLVGFYLPLVVLLRLMCFSESGQHFPWNLIPVVRRVLAISAFLSTEDKKGLVKGKENFIETPSNFSLYFLSANNRTTTGCRCQTSVYMLSQLFNRSVANRASNSAGLCDQEWMWWWWWKDGWSKHVSVSVFRFKLVAVVAVECRSSDSVLSCAHSD